MSRLRSIGLLAAAVAASNCTCSDSTVTITGEDAGGDVEVPSVSAGPAGCAAGGPGEFARRAGGYANEEVTAVVGYEAGAVAFGLLGGSGSFSDDLRIEVDSIGAFFAAAYCGDGSVAWVEPIAFVDGAPAMIRDARRASDGRIVFAGSFGFLYLGGDVIGSPIEVRFANGVTLEADGREPRTFIGVLDPQGRLENVVSFGGVGIREIRGLAVTDDSIFVAGDFGDGATIEGVQISAPGQYGLFLARLTRRFELTWAVTFSAAGATGSNMIARLDSSELVIAGVNHGDAQFEKPGMATPIVHPRFAAGISPGGELSWFSAIPGDPQAVAARGSTSFVATRVENEGGMSVHRLDERGVLEASAVVIRGRAIVTIAGLHALPGGGFFAAGMFSGPADFGRGTISFEGRPSFLAELDADGVLQSVHLIEGSGIFRTYALDVDGGPFSAVLGGSFESTLTFHGASANTTLSAIEASDIFVEQLASTTNPPPAAARVPPPRSDAGVEVDAGGPDDPIPYAKFCAAFYAAQCERDFACGCLIDQPLDRCRDITARQICYELERTLEPAIAAGRMIYDATAAREVIREVEAVAEQCRRGEAPPAKWPAGPEWVDTKGTFRGTLPPGSECTISVNFGNWHAGECEAGLCYNRVCKRGGLPNEACHRDTHFTCYDPASLELPGACVITSTSALSGVCGARIPLGDPCWSDSPLGFCAEGAYCGNDNRCVSEPPRAANGSPCTNYGECVSFWCEAGVCAPGDAPAGTRVSDALACESNLESMGVCLPAICF